LGLTGANYTNISGVGTNPSCTTACTGAEIAARDAFEWNTENAAFLPNGQGTVTGAGGVYVITVYWDANRTGATGTACSGDPQVDLNCLRVSTEM
jgi:type IV pilus assembly protein PilV